MPGRLFLITGLVLSFLIPLQAEIIKISELKREKKEFKISKNLFSKEHQLPAKENLRSVEVKKKEESEFKEVKRSLAEEIKESIIFEGYISNIQYKFALLNINGDPFFVKDGDIILEKITIISISQKKVIVKLEGNEIEIIIKGDEDEDY